MKSLKIRKLVAVSRRLKREKWREEKKYNSAFKVPPLIIHRQGPPCIPLFHSIGSSRLLLHYLCMRRLIETHAIVYCFFFCIKLLFVEFQHIYWAICFNSLFSIYTHNLSKSRKFSSCGAVACPLFGSLRDISSLRILLSYKDVIMLFVWIVGIWL